MRMFLGSTAGLAACVGIATTVQAADWSQELSNYDGLDLRVQVIQDPFIDSLKQISPEFTEFTGANVTIEGFGYDPLHEKQILNCSQRSDEYDVIFVDGIWVGEFVDAGCIDPIADRVATEDPEIMAMDDYLPSFAGQAEWEGQLQCLPIAGYWHMLHYRTDLFEQAGLEPPKTFDDIERIAEFFKDNPDYPELEGGMAMNFARGSAAGHQFFEWIYSAGGKPWESNFPGTEDAYADQTPLLNSAESLEMVEFFKRMKEYGPPGVEQYAWGERANAFSQGKVAMINNWSVRTPLFADEDTSKIVGNWGVTLFPHAEGAESVPPVGGWILCINAHSNNKDAAWDFIKWFSHPDTHKDFVLAGGPPSRISAMTDEDIIAEQFWVPTLYETAQLAWSELRPRHRATFELLDTVGLELNRAIIGDSTPQQAMDDANSKVERLLRREGLLE